MKDSRNITKYMIEKQNDMEAAVYWCRDHKEELGNACMTAISRVEEFYTEACAVLRYACYYTGEIDENAMEWNIDWMRTHKIENISKACHII